MGEIAQDDGMALHELTAEALRILQLAVTKGFKHEDVKSFMLQEWMPFAEIFANTVGAAIMWWLRKYHNMLIWMEPNSTDFDKYIGRVRFMGPLGRGDLFNFDNNDRSYEQAMLAILEDALNLL